MENLIIPYSDQFQDNRSFVMTETETLTVVKKTTLCKYTSRTDMNTKRFSGQSTVGGGDTHHLRGV